MVSSQLEAKLILLGDANVGKTHILHRFSKKQLPTTPAPTIGVEFEPIPITLTNEETINFCVWDTAGQEKFRSVTKSHYRRALGCFLVYDVTNRESFFNLTNWLEDLRSSATPNIVIMLLGNKVDLVLDNPEMRKVSVKEAQDFADDNQLFFKEVSALSNFNIAEAFKQLAENVHSRLKQNVAAEKFDYNPPKQQPNGGISFKNKQDDIVVCCGFKLF